MLGIDGRATPLALRHDPLLGAGAPHTESSLTLAPGTRLLFFTDGLIERRTRTIDEGIATLVSSLERHWANDLEDLCDDTIASTRAGDREDDLCLLAVAIEG